MAMIELQKRVHSPETSIAIVGMSGNAPDIGGNSDGQTSVIMMKQNENIVVNKANWNLWTCKQVSTWVEMELRKGIANMV